MSARDLRQLAGELLHAAADRLIPRSEERPRLVAVPQPLTQAQLAVRGCSCRNPYVAGGMEEDCDVHGVPAWLQDQVCDVASCAGCATCLQHYGDDR